VPARVLHQKMNVVGSHHIIEHREAETLLGLEEPAQVTAPIARKLQYKCLVVAAVGEVPDVTGQKRQLARGIACLLERLFTRKKTRPSTWATPILRSYVVGSICCAGPTRCHGASSAASSKPLCQLGAPPRCGGDRYNESDCHVVSFVRRVNRR
jgi:hypothetical protein